MTTQETKNNALQGIQLLEGKETIEGQIKARQNALKSCVNGRVLNVEGFRPEIFTGWVNSHKKALRELYFRRIVLTTKTN